jgi:hypothetical protein
MCENVTAVKKLNLLLYKKKNKIIIISTMFCNLLISEYEKVNGVKL